jgi:hypothetical protein
MGAEGALAVASGGIDSLEMAPTEVNQNQNCADRAARLAKRIVIPAFVVGMIGIAGGAYCDKVAGRSTQMPVPSFGLTYPANYKRSTRYVTRLDAKIVTRGFPLPFQAWHIHSDRSFISCKFGKSLGS